MVASDEQDVERRKSSTWRTSKKMRLSRTTHSPVNALATAYRATRPCSPQMPPVNPDHQISSQPPPTRAVPTRLPAPVGYRDLFWFSPPMPLHPVLVEQSYRELPSWRCAWRVAPVSPWSAKMSTRLAPSNCAVVCSEMSDYEISSTARGID